MCFGGRQAREERKFCLKVSLLGFPDVFVSRSAPTAASEVVSSSALIGPFEPNHALATRPSTKGKRTFCRESSVTRGLPRAIF